MARIPLRPAKTAARPVSRPAAKTTIIRSASKPSAKPVHDDDEDDVPVNNSKEPALFNTVSLIGLLLASLRSRDPSVLDAAYAYVPGFMMDLQKYKIPFPGMFLDRVRTQIFAARWTEAGKTLKDFSDAFANTLRKSIMVDSSVRAETVSLLNTFLDMVAVKNPDRWGKMESTALNKLKYLHNPILAQLWRVHIEGDQSDEMENLKDIVEEVRGRKSRVGDDARDVYLLSYGEQEKLRSDNPELNKKYNAAKNSALKKYRNALRNWILDKGGEPQPIPKAREVMENQGYLIHEMPTELDSLKIGSDAFYYTPEGAKIINRPGPGSKILRFNENYDPNRSNDGNNWIFQYKATDESEGSYAYAEEFKRESKDIKSDTVLEHIEAVPAMRPKWLADLRGKDLDKQTLALITDMLYHFAARIGGVGNKTKGVGNTYGISTLQVQHIKKSGSGYKIEYLGKKGQKQVHVISASNVDEKRYIPIIEDLMEGKKKTDNLFTFENGKDVSANDVRAYFRKLGIPVNPHSLRHIKGTNTIIKLMETPEVKKRKFDQKEAESFFKKQAEEVGRVLGHFRAGGTQTTGTTAIQSYIAVEYIHNWFRGRNLRVPLWAKLGAKED